MASSRKSQQATDFSSLMGSSFPAREMGSSLSKPESGWEMRLKLSQVIMLWGALAGMMLAVFLFGLYAGREQGIKIALEEHSGETIRLPLASPIAIAEPGKTAAPASAEAAAMIGGAKDAPASLAGNAALAGKSAQELNIDFSAQAKPASAELAKLENAAEATTASKPTIEIFRDDFVAKQAPTSPEAAEDKSLAARAALRNDSKNIDAKASEAQTLDAKSNVSKLKADTSAATTSALAKEPAIPVPSKKSGPGWYIQVAAARSKAEATQILKKVQAAGQAARLEEAKVSGGTYYRIVVGPYASKDVAGAAKKSIESGHLVKSEPFLRFIK